MLTKSWSIFSLLVMLTASCGGIVSTESGDTDSPCTVGDIQVCIPDGNTDVSGTQECEQDGTWSECVETANPQTEICDGIDNDNDGLTDEGLTQVCYSGASETQDIGICSSGVQQCVHGVWDNCNNETLPAQEVCDYLDNDCDGVTDEDLGQACYTGPTGTQDVGLCKSGTEDCHSSGCVNEVLPTQELCDGFDNDCDGQTDEDLTQACYTGPAGTQDVGACTGGTQQCVSGSWGTCSSEILPTSEACDYLDNDCDGITDEDLGQVCYTGPAGTQDVGVCHAGTMSCHDSTCVNQVMPIPELCDGLDNDCDGQTDENLFQPCFSGPSELEGIGVCKSGTQQCNLGIWGSCEDEVLPSQEVCDNQDNDCDDYTDENLSRSCYTGPAGTENVGVCTNGTQICASGMWGTCADEVIPSIETCDNADNDCDTMTDEDLIRSCYTGPGGTENVGACASGTQACASGVWGLCSDEVMPSSEICDNIDNDCDTMTDESLIRSCYTGPAGTENVGLCVGSTQQCSAGLWGSCIGEVLPQTETCDELDDDCDGQTDEDFGVNIDCNTDGPCGQGTYECSGIVSPEIVCSTELGGSVYVGGVLECGDSITDTTEIGKQSLADYYYTCTSRIVWLGKEAVYAFTSTTTQEVTIALTDLSSDLDLLVLKDECGAYVYDCDFSSNLRNASEQIGILDAPAGTTYYIIVDSRNDLTGENADFRLTVTCN